MSTILTLKQAPAETIDLLLARPELAVVFWMNPDYTPPKTPAILIWIAKLLGHYEPPMELPEAPPELTRNGEELELEEAGFPWLLERRGTNGPESWVWPPDHADWTPVPGSSHGFGDDCVIAPGIVARLEEDLSKAGSSAESDAAQAGLKTLRPFLASARGRALGVVAKLS